jgi:multimeric flavodoxin WrbA
MTEKKHIVVIAASFRRGNSERLGDAFIKGARAAGHRVEKISLRTKKIRYCTGCEACAATGLCVLSDDAPEIAEKMVNADAVVFAVPIYFGNIPGQLKTLFDRMNPYFRKPYRFRKIVILACADQDRQDMFIGAKQSVESWRLAFSKAKLMDTLFVGGVNHAGDIDGHPALKQAEALGRNLY